MIRNFNLYLKLWKYDSVKTICKLSALFNFLVTILSLLLSITFCYSQGFTADTSIQLNGDTSLKHAAGTFPVVKVTYAEEYSGYGTGSGFVTANKGYKFFGVYVNVSNPTKALINLNLTDVLLLDMANKIKYRVHSVMGTGPFTVFKKEEYSLKPGKDLNRKLVYIIPKDFNAEILFYGQNVILIGKIHK